MKIITYAGGTDDTKTVIHEVDRCVVLLDDGTELLLVEPDSGTLRIRPSLEILTLQASFPETDTIDLNV